MPDYLFASMLPILLGSQRRRIEENTQVELLNTVWPIEDRIDQIELACAAMWEVLRDRFQLTDAELLAKIEEIDLRDDTRGHKIVRDPNHCPNCDRPIGPKKRARCIYCGAGLPQAPAEPEG